MLIQPSSEKEIAREWKRWLQRKVRRPAYLYHVTESASVRGIQQHGFKLSRSSDLGKGVYLFGSLAGVRDWLDENEYNNPVILKIRRPSFALHSSEVIQSGLVSHNPRTDWVRFDQMWLIRQPYWKPNFTVIKVL